MEDNNSQAHEKIRNFFKAVLRCYGSEIGLSSNQYFSIDQICDSEEEQSDELNFVAQYGFPQSGGVTINFKVSKVKEERKTITICNVNVYAPPKEKKIMIANFSPEIQTGYVGISANFGLDVGTEEHTSTEEIEANPNALKMLEIATEDLNQAQILGECRLVVQAGSSRIPCCECTHISNNKGGKSI